MIQIQKLEEFISIECYNQNNSGVITYFILPHEIRWDTVEYREMTELLPEKISDPPILQYWNKEQIREGFERPLEIPEYPCHTQSVEREVFVCFLKQVDEFIYMRRDMDIF